RLKRALDVCGMGADGDRDVLCDPRPPGGEAADRVLRRPLADDARVRGKPEHGLHPRRYLHQSAEARAVTFGHPARSAVRSDRAPSFETTAAAIPPLTRRSTDRPAPPCR